MTARAILLTIVSVAFGDPVFLRENNESRAHGNDERISLRNFEAGAVLLFQIVTAVTQ